MTKKPSRGVLVLRLGLASSFLVGVCALFAGACGAAAETTLHFGGESHFLRHCSGSCDDGLDCISGVCTRGCVVEQEHSCSRFMGAACTSDSFEPGAVAVCDVKCSGDADCRALGGDYACDVGFCRAPELVAGLGSGGSSGASATGAGEADAGAEVVDCAAYRNRPGETPLAVVIRNERSTPVYLRPFQPCNDATNSRVKFERDGQDVNVRGYIDCGYRSCDDVQVNGPREPRACTGSCTIEPPLVRLEPGAELDGGQSWTEFVSHGILNSTERMPDACVPGQKDPQIIPGTECFAQIPLPSGAYRITAQAFADIQCLSDNPCDCTPDSGSCITSSQLGNGSAILATVDVQVPGSTVAVTFRDESTPPPVEPPGPEVPAPVIVVPVPGDCPFEYLGEWIRCENAGWPNVVPLDTATSMEDCMRACLEREDCTAVTDYFWLGQPDLGCWLYTSTCDLPASQVWAEEDGGHDYRKACPAD